MLYTVEISTNGPTNVSDTFRASSDAHARILVKQSLDRIRERGLDARVDRLVEHDGTPPRRVDMAGY